MGSVSIPFGKVGVRSIINDSGREKSSGRTLPAAGRTQPRPNLELGLWPSVSCHCWLASGALPLLIC